MMMNKSYNTHNYNRLLYARQTLYRLYDLAVMNEPQLRNTVFTYILMKEHNINEDTTVEGLKSIKSKIEKGALTTDYRVKSLALKKLDTLLTLIALRESENKQAWSRLLVTNKLIDEGIVVYNNHSNSNNNNTNGNDSNDKNIAYDITIDIEKTMHNIARKKDELEREIIELKKKQYYI